MHKVKIKFDHPDIEGVLHVNLSMSELEQLNKYKEYGGFHLFAGTEMALYAELGHELQKHVTVEKLHELPTEEGVYMDCDGNIWRLNDLGVWSHLAEDRVRYTEPEHFLPFTQLKLGRTY